MSAGWGRGRAGAWRLCGKKLILSLVTTLPKERAPKEDTLLLLPLKGGPQATAGSLGLSAAPG